MKEPKTVFSSEARTATPSDANLTIASLGGFFIINVTAAAATPSVVFTVSGVDPSSGEEFTILVSAAITGTGTTVLRVHPSLTAAANLVAKDMLPQGINVKAVHADGDSITYSVSFVGVS